MVFDLISHGRVGMVFHATRLFMPPITCLGSIPSCSCLVHCLPTRISCFSCLMSFCHSLFLGSRVYRSFHLSVAAAQNGLQPATDLLSLSDIAAVNNYTMLYQNVTQSGVVFSVPPLYANATIPANVRVFFFRISSSSFSFFFFICFPLSVVSFILCAPLYFIFS